MYSKKFLLTFLVFSYIGHLTAVSEEDEGVIYANRCEGKLNIFQRQTGIYIFYSLQDIIHRIRIQIR